MASINTSNTNGTASTSGAQSIVGSADVVQLNIRANATQTSTILQVQNSALSPLLTLSGTGSLSVGPITSGNATHTFRSASNTTMVISAGGPSDQATLEYTKAGTAFWRTLVDSSNVYNFVYAPSSLNVGNISTAGAWAIGPSAGLGTGSAAYHTINGSVRGQAGSATRAVFGGSLEGYLSGNIYRDGAGTAKAITTTTGATHIGAYAASSGTATAMEVVLTTSAQTADTALTGMTTVMSINGSGQPNFPLIHNGNNAQNLASGTYTPSPQNLANCIGFTITSASFLRVGNVASVSVQMQVQVSLANTLSQYRLTLPIASTVAGTSRVRGTGVRDTAAPGQPTVLIVTADASVNQAMVQFVSIDTANRNVWLHFQYEIV